MWLQPENYLRVGAILESAREGRKLTQADLAQRLRKPQSFVSSYERGQRRVDVLEFLAIAGVLGADPVKLFKQVVDAGPAPKPKRSR